MKAPRLACLALLLAAAAVSAAPVNLHAPQVAATAADAVAQDEDRRLNSHNVRRKLKKRALDEFDLLDTLGKKRAMKVLDRMALLDSDSDKLHFEPRSGNIFIEDSFDLPAFNATLEAEQQQQRQRRAISDAKPQRYLSNGLPIFHSKPGSANVMYLDFDGHDIVNSYWGSYKAKPFSKVWPDSSFSASEQDDIADVWARVTEDYAPWDIDVTTEAPPLPWSDKVLQVLITDYVDANGRYLPSSSAGGVAYLSIFGESDIAPSRPAFVYYPNLSGRSDFIGECVSHEAGHNLGLSHDGQYSSTYYLGDGTWAPIMGAGYNNKVSQWSRGEYAGATNKEDDVAIISSHLPLRSDEAGASAASAASVSFTSSTDFKAFGVINSRNDVDWWRIEVHGSGTLMVSVKTWSSVAYTPGANLDVALRLLSASGAEVSSNNPSHSTSASLTVLVNPGTYYLEVDGVGLSGFYSDYASLGQYDIAGSVPAGSVVVTTTTAATPTTTTTTTTTITKTSTTSTSSSSKASTTTTSSSAAPVTASTSVAPITVNTPKLNRGEAVFTKDCRCRGVYRDGSAAKVMGLNGQGLLQFCLYKKTDFGALYADVSAWSHDLSTTTFRFRTPTLYNLKSTVCVLYRPLEGEDNISVNKFKVKLQKADGARGKVKWNNM